jgi:hypothetical protein
MTGGRLLVKGIQFRYIGYIKSSHLLLKYHNLHQDPSEYIHRIFDIKTGKELLSETLTRSQFPTFPEVLDELELIASR